jgi:hypothetical protein
MSGSRLVSYYELPLSADAVREVVLGPRSVVEEQELRLFLDDVGLGHVTVRESSATYRR